MCVHVNSKKQDFCWSVFKISNNLVQVISETPACHKWFSLSGVIFIGGKKTRVMPTNIIQFKPFLVFLLINSICR